jgi:hypothetical protein
MQNTTRPDATRNKDGESSKDHNDSCCSGKCAINDLFNGKFFKPDLVWISERAVKVVTRPQSVWNEISADSRGVKQDLSEYLVYLALVLVVCQFVGLWLVGATVPFVGKMRIGVFLALAHAIVQYLVLLSTVMASAYISSALAPRFGAPAVSGSSGLSAAFKLWTYSMTAYMLAGVMMLVPDLSNLVKLAAAYSIFTYYQGITPMLDIPEQRRIPFFLVSILAVFIAFYILQAVGSSLVSIPAYSEYIKLPIAPQGISPQ